MHILRVSSSDIGGGAEGVSWRLHKSTRQRGHQSTVIVGRKLTNDPNVLELPHRAPPQWWWARPMWSLYARSSPLESRIPGTNYVRTLLRCLAGGKAQVAQVVGREDFHFPASHRLLKMVSSRPDIVHCHNLHGGYFDLRYLVKLSRLLPVILTVHDEWLLTGHCASSMGCDRWKTGCGKCPDLAIYPPLERDGTARNWRRKAQIYRQSHLYVSTASQWMLDRIKCSMLQPVEMRLIRNGVDLSIFHPSDRRITRESLNLPADKYILLFAALSATNNPFKDYTTVRRAIERVAVNIGRPVDLMLVALGSNACQHEILNGVEVRHVPFVHDAQTVAHYFQAADIYLHAARAELFGTVLVEAQACGTPVIATAVGGISEALLDEKTGYLVPAGDDEAMAMRTVELLSDLTLRLRMSAAAVEHARSHFDFAQQVDAYMSWYEQILASWPPA